MNCQKEHFTIDPAIHYLNGAYMSPQLKSSELIGKHAVERKNEPWKIRPDDYFSEVDQLRNLFSRLINNTSPERIAVIPSVSYGITNAARNIDFKPGERIVILEKQFPSNYYIWKELADSYQLDLHTVRIPDTLQERGKTWNEALLKSIQPGTKAIAIEQLHWTDGTLFDLAAVSARAKEVGALLIVDATQSLGMYEFDQTKIQADVIVAASYKWMLGPYSFGCAYYGEAFDHGKPIEISWMNKQGSEVFEKLSNYEPAFKSGAYRYNLGEQSQFIHLPMLCNSLRQILDWGVKNMQTYCKSLVDQCIPAFKEHGLWIEDSDARANHLFGLRSESGFKPELRKKLLEANIYVSYRDDAIRISPGVYSTIDDLMQLVKIIADNK